RNVLVTCISRVTPSARTHMGARLIGSDRSWNRILAAWRLGGLVGQDLPPRRQERQGTNREGRPMRKWWNVLAGAHRRAAGVPRGLAAVTAGAAAQHLWLDEASRALAETATRYGLPHAAALVALAALVTPERSLARALLAIAGSAVALGMTLFSGSLYALA